MTFPKIIHQIWYQGYEHRPKLAIQSEKSWKEMNKGYEYKHWDEKEIEVLVNDKFSWFVKTWNNFKHMHQKIDCAKYMILYTYGGIYAESDSIAINSFNNLLNKYNQRKEEVIVTAFENHPSKILNLLPPSYMFIHNAIIACKQNSDVMIRLLKAVIKRVENNPPDIKMITITETTGPRMFSLILQSKGIKEKVALETSIEYMKNFTLQNQNDFLVVRDIQFTWSNKTLQTIVETMKGVSESTGIAGVSLLSFIILFSIISIMIFNIKRISNKKTLWLSFILTCLYLCNQFLVRPWLTKQLEQRPDIANQKPLPDIIHDNIDLEQYNMVPEIILALISFFCVIYTTKYFDETMYQKLLLSLIIVCSIRIPVMFLTQLPPSCKDCSSGWFDTEMSSFFLDNHENPKKAPVDYFFSGHTGVFTTMLLFLACLSNVKNGYLYAIIVIFMYGGMVSAVKNHYTIDVVVGFMVALIIHLAVFYKINIKKKNIKIKSKNKKIKYR